MTTELSVVDASCGHCKSAIESAVTSLPGVQRAELDLSTKRLRVEHDNGTDSREMRLAVERAGYTVGSPT